MNMDLYHEIIHNKLLMDILNVDKLQLHNLFYNSNDGVYLEETSSKLYEEILLEMDEHFIYKYSYNKRKQQQLKRIDLYYDYYHRINDNAIYKIEKGKKKYYEMKNIEVLNYYNGIYVILYVYYYYYYYCYIYVICSLLRG